MIRSFHDGMMAGVSDLGTTSEAFPETNATKQSFVMAQLLFCVIFSAFLPHLLCNAPRCLQELQQWCYDQTQR